MSVQYLWAQNVVRDGRVEIRKIGTDSSRAGLLTKHLPRARMESLLRAMGYRFEPPQETADGICSIRQVSRLADPADAQTVPRSPSHRHCSDVSVTLPDAFPAPFSRGP